MMLTEFRRGFSVLIPTYLNFPYLEKTVESLRRHSGLDHEIILHINDGRDGTREWAERNGIKHTHSPRNIGVSAALNRARKLGTREILVYFNDDMVALPEWDTRLAEFAAARKFGKHLWLSSTMIEPRRTRKSVSLSPFDFGDSPKSFDEGGLLQALPGLRTWSSDIQGGTWAPNLMYAEIWDRIGGFSEEYFPGWGSDPDLAKKMWDIGVRNFIAVGTSLVYHFQCKTTSRVTDPGDCRQIFQDKHGIAMEYFMETVLGGRRVWPDAGPDGGSPAGDGR
jgi:GT2 family glycosyltransferase